MRKARLKTRNKQEALSQDEVTVAILSSERTFHAQRISGPARAPRSRRRPVLSAQSFCWNLFRFNLH